MKLFKFHKMFTDLRSVLRFQKMSMNLETKNSRTLLGRPMKAERSELMTQKIAKSVFSWIRTQVAVTWFGQPQERLGIRDEHQRQQYKNKCYRALYLHTIQSII